MVTHAGQVPSTRWQVPMSAAPSLAFEFSSSLASLACHLHLHLSRPVQHLPRQPHHSYAIPPACGRRPAGQPAAAAARWLPGRFSQPPGATQPPPAAALSDYAAQRSGYGGRAPPAGEHRRAASFPVQQGEERARGGRYPRPAACGRQRPHMCWACSPPSPPCALFWLSWVPGMTNVRGARPARAPRSSLGQTPNAARSRRPRPARPAPLPCRRWRRRWGGRSWTTPLSTTLTVPSTTTTFSPT